MKTISRILAVIDPTEHEQPAMRRAAWLASSTGAELELLVCYYNEYLSGDRLFDSPCLEKARAEVIDLRSLSPLDEAAILTSLEKTGRMVIIDESTPRCSIARDIAAMCVDKGFDFLQAPVKCVTAPHTPVPFSKVLEQAFIPSPQDVLDAVGEMG